MGGAEQRTALVVLNPGTGDSASRQSSRASEVPPDSSVVRSVTSAFRNEGFEVGPFVGISFAISGSRDVFDRVFGVDPNSAEFSGGELPTDRLDSDVTRHLAGVTVTEPPAFGPGNP